MARLKRDFYLRPTDRVARELLGKILCVKTDERVERVRIVETEAYLGEKDRAAHSYGGRRTARTEPMFRDGGYVYVYFIYGMHFCLNFITRGPGIPEAVLIRAVEPLAAKDRVPRAAMRTNGPGKLCRALGITREDNDIDSLARTSRIWIEDAPLPSPREIEKSSRIGIDGSGEAKDLLLRYALSESPYVSGPRGKRK